MAKKKPKNRQERKPSWEKEQRRRDKKIEIHIELRGADDVLNALSKIGEPMPGLNRPQRLRPAALQRQSDGDSIG